ncbi:methyltransferase domain-containing protein [Polycladomyces sp. WAk]|uniref:Methyltransferase domain-containing protein n=1 Tax=Polycladomyces zharkentensis TaxID=2807616 RepID=A0ABS2WJS9_9BACL|nr:methyltransferase domain-containing protein [Polycladomyces sp. WAk]MBN2909644.1 methyltransferase domain-containing protein [Polycladomyces sp. WAk]
MICSTGHCFDLSKYGYIHLLPRPVKPAKYDKAMFESRHVICRSGFFSELVEQIRDIVRNGIGNTHKRINVLDAGCGEGSHLADLVKGLGLTDAEVLGVGMDISKYGIRIASREYPGLIWCVADLAQSPFMDQQFDVILNIFSPSNYSEFARMLHDDGVLIKIVPGRDYLKELRNIFYGQTDKQSYSNERVVTHFRQHFRLVDTRQIRYSRRLNPTDLKHLIYMTPLSWGTTEKNIQRVLQMGISSVTIDVTMVVGKKG